MIDLQLSLAGHHKYYRGTRAGQRTLRSLACAHLEAAENAELRLALSGWNESEQLPAQEPISSIYPSVEINAELEAMPITLHATHTGQRSYFSSPDASFWVDASGNRAALTHCTLNPVP